MKRRRPNHPNGLAKFIVDMATGQIPKDEPPEPLDPELVAALPKTRQPTQEEIAAAREKTAKARR